MTDVNVDLVHGEYATDFFQDGGARSLDAISAKERVDVVGVNAILVDDGVGITLGELSQPRNI